MTTAAIRLARAVTGKKGSQLVDIMVGTIGILVPQPGI